MVPLLINRATNYRLCKGGSHRLSNALTKFMLEYGGEILTNAEIKRIIMEGDTAKGTDATHGGRGSRSYKTILYAGNSNSGSGTITGGWS